MPPFADLAQLLVLMLGTGAVAGVISGLLGVGGGIFLVPVFHYAFTKMGYQPEQLMQICVATSTGTIIATSVRSVTAHARRGAVDFAMMRAWGPFIALGAVAGVLAAASLRSESLMLVFGGIGVSMGLYMLLGRAGWTISDRLPGPMLRSLYAGAIGFFSALMGIGGGSFTVPLLTAYGVGAHRAVATSAGFGMLISVPAFLMFLITGWGIEGKPPLTVGYVNLLALGVVVGATSLTVPLGVSLAHRLPAARLRLVFACIIIVMAGNMLRKALMG